MISETLSLSVGAASLAVAFHIAIIPHEIDFIVWKLLAGYSASLGAVFYYLFRQTSSVSAAFLATLLVASVFNASLVLSILIHRVFLHRTKGFNGPFLARVSKFYDVYLSSKNLQHHKEIEKVLGSARIREPMLIHPTTAPQPVWRLCPRWPAGDLHH